MRNEISGYKIENENENENEKMALGSKNPVGKKLPACETVPTKREVP